MYNNTKRNKKTKATQTQPNTMKIDYHLNQILYCKQTFKYCKTIYYIKNKPYKIVYLSDDMIRIKTEINDDVCFSILKTNNDQYKLYEYFYTENEYRKQKLLKLKKVLNISRTFFIP